MDNKASKQIITSITIIVSLLILIAGGYMIASLYTSNCNVDGNNGASSASSNTSLGAYKLYVSSDNYITVPQDWRVSKAYSIYNNLTEDEQDFLPGELHGLWPIHKKTLVALTNGTSYVEFVKSPIFAHGGIGGSVDVVKGDYTVVAEPTADKIGAVRYKVDDRYEYYPIQKNDDYDPDAIDEFSSSKYWHVGMGKGDFVMYFSGSDSDLDTADKLFIEACVENTSGWCSEIW